jgi:DNA-binding MarR family transcriptional regulator
MRKKAATESTAEPRPGLDRFLTYRLHVLNKLSDKQTSDMYEAKLGMSTMECRCLAAVGYFHPVSVKDLAQLANLDKSQASRAALSLFEAGLVERLARDGDSRGVDLVLTKKGAGIYEKVIALATQRNTEAFSVLTDAERHLLGDMLDRLIAHTQAQ